MSKPDYLDAAATTPVDSRVLEKMMPFFSEIFGNASSNHAFGRQAKSAIEDARKHVASIINSDPSEIYFTSGATESINWALKGFLEANPEKGNHVITVKTEHKAVLNTCEYLESKGFEVTYLDVDANGLISIEELLESITSATCLIAVMYVNNEIGVIQDISTIGKIAKEKGIVFFCDATQAIGKVSVDVFRDHIDLLCFSGHKMNGPKGIGALYIRENLKISPLIHGGGQEKGLRGGTYNTPLIVGFGEACRIAKLEFVERVKSLKVKRSEIENYFLSNSYGIINFDDQNTAPHILSISLNEKDAEDFLIEKNHEFVASIGSACNLGLVEKSHVYKAIQKLKNKEIIRISFF